mmetsp:Transcript_29962/g.80103  ORF Transcript_29962/g.80103 Transcript_29962/m.80103 type:complete len:236 (+) Transcript_29962:279-986(+)
MNDYLAQDKGLGVMKATLVQTLFGIGSLIGQIVGGQWGQRLYNRRPALQPILMGVAAILGAPAFMLLMNLKTKSMFIYLSVSLAVGVLTSLTGVNVRAVLQNVTRPSGRGISFAIFNLTDDMGKGLGPFLVSSLIGITGSRIAAFNIATMFWVLCGVANLLLAYTITKDVAKVLHGDDHDEESDGQGGGRRESAEEGERGLELAERRAGGRGKGPAAETYSPLVAHDMRNRAVVV